MCDVLKKIPTSTSGFVRLIFLRKMRESNQTLDSHAPMTPTLQSLSSVRGPHSQDEDDEVHYRRRRRDIVPTMRYTKIERANLPAWGNRVMGSREGSLFVAHHLGPILHLRERAYTREGTVRRGRSGVVHEKPTVNRLFSYIEPRLGRASVPMWVGLTARAPHAKTYTPREFKSPRRRRDITTAEKEKGGGRGAWFMKLLILFLYMKYGKST